MSTSKQDTILENIEKQLKQYRENEVQIAVLNYELTHPARVNPTEILEAMNFAKAQGEGHASGGVSDKTLFIAMNYQDEAARLNQENISDISSRLFELEQSNKRMDYYVSLLEPRQQTVIRMFYFEGVPWEMITKKLDVALRTAHNIRKQALLRLAELFSYADGVR